MTSPAKDILSTTWSAVEASISVILVLAYGYWARKAKTISPAGEESASHLCVTLFLPSLLFAEIGPLASWSNLKEYWIVIAYSLLFQIISWVVGLVGVWVFKMPQWIVPCMVFNNVEIPSVQSSRQATSLPVLLLKSLGENGTLSPLIGNDDLVSVLKRGNVYILINALVCSLTRFTFGPGMMSSHTPVLPHPYSDSENYPQIRPYAETQRPTEDTPLIDGPQPSVQQGWKLIKGVSKKVDAFMNPPMYGGIAAVVAGVIPFLHKLLFSNSAPLPRESPFPLDYADIRFTRSIHTIGSLYPALQMFVLGAHLRSKSGYRPPIFPLVYLFVFRFLIMPAISSSVVYGVRKAAGHRILYDPVLDFVMMICPVGPPALTLAAIVAMSDADEDTNAAVAKTIVLSYCITPLVSLSVTVAIHVVQKLY